MPKPGRLAPFRPVLACGSFVTASIDFVIPAFIVFPRVKQMNRLKRAAPPVEAVTPEDTALLREIRAALKTRAAPGR